MQRRRDITLSTVVMAHPDRSEQAEQLRRDHPELEIDIVLDPDPGGKPATLRTAKLAWSTVRAGATHLLVLQDDVLLCHGFEDAVARALPVAPDGAVSFFADWSMSTAQAIRLAAFAGASWTPVVDRWLPAQALVLPAPLALGFADYADREDESTPDNVVLARYLAEKGVRTYVSIPNLVEHAAKKSLLFNDLLFGLRESTVFAGSAELGAEPFTAAVVAPPAVAHLGLGDFGALGHYQPLGGAGTRPWVESHKLLIKCGMSTRELAECYFDDAVHHPEAAQAGFSESLLFHFWITMFAQGVIACGILGSSDPEAFDQRFEQSRWARAALATFPTSALRRTCPPETIRESCANLTPLCVTAMRSGFAAVRRWPMLRTLWTPDQYLAVIAPEDTPPGRDTTWADDQSGG